MGWLKATFTSTIGTKVLVGLTGLGLLGFLLGHVGGNLLIYVNDGVAINDYAHALHQQPWMPLAEWGLIALFGIHIVLTLRLTKMNRDARGSRYKVSGSKRDNKASTFSSKMMAISGLIVLVFLVVHLKDFRFAFGFFRGEWTDGVAAAIIGILSTWRGPLYLIGSLLVGWHLFHGIQSAFRSLGFNHKKYTPLLIKGGIALAVLVGLGFASIPLAIMSGKLSYDTAAQAHKASSLPANEEQH